MTLDGRKPLTLLEAAQKAVEIIEWVSTTRYEREAIAEDMAAIKAVIEAAKS